MLKIYLYLYLIEFNNRKAVIRHLISMEERTFPKVITMGDVMDSTLMQINIGNAKGTHQRGLILSLYYYS